MTFIFSLHVFLEFGRVCDIGCLYQNLYLPVLRKICEKILNFDNL